MGERTRDFLARTGAPYIVKPFDAYTLLAEVRRVLYSS
jgi:DNA-binding response OmpR family regulator